MNIFTADFQRVSGEIDLLEDMTGLITARVYAMLHIHCVTCITQTTAFWGIISLEQLSATRKNPIRWFYKHKLCMLTFEKEKGQSYNWLVCSVLRLTRAWFRVSPHPPSRIGPQISVGDSTDWQLAEWGILRKLVLNQHMFVRKSKIYQTGLIYNLKRVQPT